MSSPVTEDSEDRPSPLSPEVIKSDCESFPGSKPAVLNHSGEERGSAHCAPEPEAAAPADASERSAGADSVDSKRPPCDQQAASKPHSTLR